VEEHCNAEFTGKSSRREVMKTAAAPMIAAIWREVPAFAKEERMTDRKKSQALPSVLTYDDVRAVSPALEHYTKGPLLDGLWRRP
jgi:4-carboxymuconolactone decarboxylase